LAAAPRVNFTFCGPARATPFANYAARKLRRVPGCSNARQFSKRLVSRYRSGRSQDWLKFKNPEAPAVKREAEKNWGK